ncbi:hypothetical protein AXG93_4509s1030 [Marchantia polymorpha subsp. ruderalis]|uniref:Uncharacterized protein n=1 Tax=Marchantia polymorpha subsp. ruderalis TaxID=1480154 RepID=A0A176WLD7_MARPO|nr:hypothetical protein AXG93_4509s1030 [Marchantia polymorpha subsp. ruderalis]
MGSLSYEYRKSLVNAFGGGDFGRTPLAYTCAFGGTGHLRRESLRRDKTKQRKRQDALTSVNAFGGSAFSAAPTSADIFKGTPSALRESDFGGRHKPWPWAFGDAEREKSGISQRRSTLPPHDMVREWLKGKDQPTRGFQPHPERWTVSNWEQVLGRCAGEEGHLLLECESINVSKEEEATFPALFKHSKLGKNGYKTRDYKDRFRRNGSTHPTSVAASDHLHDFLAGGVRGADVVRSSDSLGSHFVKGDKTTRIRGEGRVDQSPLPLLDQFLSVDGMSDRNRASAIPIAVTQQPGLICEGRQS